MALRCQGCSPAPPKVERQRNRGVKRSTFDLSSATSVPGRQIDGDSRAGADFAVDGDRAAVQLDQLPGDRESEAEAGVVITGPDEPVNDPRELVRGNARTGVANSDSDMIRVTRAPREELSPEVDFPAWLGVAQGVGNEVIK